MLKQILLRFRLINFLAIGGGVSEPHADYTKRRIEIDINPHLGSNAIAKVDIDDIKDAFNICVERYTLNVCARISNY